MLENDCWGIAMQFEKGREEGIRLGNIEGLFVTYKIMKKKDERGTG